jgi:Universal stress protein UspA and related nucleotide-binding proteins
MKFLVPVDFTDITNPLLRTAKRLALKHSAKIILLHAVSPVIYLPYPESFGISPIDLSKLSELEGKNIELAKQRLSALCEFLSPVSVDVLVDVGDPAEVILSKEDLADLIILGSHRKGLIEKILIGSTSEKVVRYSHKPVLVIKGKEAENFKNVCVAHDLSKYAQKAFEFFLNLIPAEEGSRLTILHIEETVEIPMVDVITEKISKQIVQEKTKYFESLIEKAQSRGWTAELIIEKHSSVSSGIVQFLKQKEYDLLVMGSRGLSGFKRVILGSTSSDVVKKVEIPVLIHKDFNL